MGLLLKDPLHDEFAFLALGYVPYGGADAGEVVAIARAIGDGDDSAYYDAWTAAADRLVEDGDAYLSKDQRRSAREFYLHATSFYSFSYRPLFGEPVDPRLQAAFRKQMATFDKAVALSEPLIERLQIPFEGTTLPGYLIRAVGHAIAADADAQDDAGVLIDGRVEVFALRLAAFGSQHGEGILD